MWYEILPSFAGVFIGLALPCYGTYVMNYMAFGTGYRRYMKSVRQQMECMRDEDLSGNTYKTYGLEQIPDE